MPSTTSVPVSQIARVVAISVAKLVAAGAGSALIYRQLMRSGKLKTTTLPKDLSTVNINLFLPLFIFTRCADGLTLDVIQNLAFIPLLVLLFMLSGLFGGYMTAQLTSTTGSTRSIMLTVCTFSNVIGMPLPLLESLIDGLYDSTSNAQSRGASILFMCNTVMSPLMWSCAGRLLRSGTEAPRSVMLHGTSSSEAAVVEDGKAGEAEGGAIDKVSEGQAGDVCAEPAEASSSSRPTACGAGSAYRRVRGCCFGMNRPTAATFAGILVGLTPPLRSLLVEHDAPLRWIFDCAALLGGGAIPVIVFVLGANLSAGAGASGGATGLSRLAIGATLLTKLAVVPAANLCLILLSMRLGLVDRGPDGLLPLCLLIVGASPTAMNISISAPVPQRMRSFAHAGQAPTTTTMSAHCRPVRSSTARQSRRCRAQASARSRCSCSTCTSSPSLPSLSSPQSVCFSSSDV